MEAKVNAARNNSLRKKDEGMGTTHLTEKNSSTTTGKGFPRGIHKILSESLSKQHSFDNNMQTLNVSGVLA
jgi:hypothetical protein